MIFGASHVFDFKIFPAFRFCYEYIFYVFNKSSSQPLADDSILKKSSSLAPPLPKLLAKLSIQVEVLMYRFQQSVPDYGFFSHLSEWARGTFGQIDQILVLNPPYGKTCILMMHENKSW